MRIQSKKERGKAVADSHGDKTLPHGELLGLGAAHGAESELHGTHRAPELLVEPFALEELFE